MIEFKQKEQKAPCCGHRLDAASGLDHDMAPSQGDYSVCINCGSWLVFENDLSLRLMRDSEAAGLNPEQCQHLLEATKIILERGLIDRKR